MRFSLIVAPSLLCGKVSAFNLRLVERLHLRISSVFIAGMLGAFFIYMNALATSLGCEAQFNSPCKFVTAWESLPGFEVLVNYPRIEKLGAEANTLLAESMLKKMNQGKISPVLREILKVVDPSVGAHCLALTVTNNLVPQFKIQSQKCSDSLIENLRQHFITPSDDLVSDWHFIDDAVVILRPFISSEAEREYLLFIDELKNEYLRILIAKKVKKKYLDLVRGIKYEPEVCTGSRDRGRIELASKNKIHTCQGFAWNQHSIFQAIWTFAHEMGHVLDVCGLNANSKTGAQPTEKNIAKLIATHPTPEFYEYALKNAVDAKDWVEEYTVCSFRNLHEAYADVVASLIAPAVIDRVLRSKGINQPDFFKYGYSSVGLRICRQMDELPAYSRHPLGDNRLRFLLSQPPVKLQTQCGGSY